ncbi:PPE domain-containing protein [Gandjariella thermophila]|uniref:PPE domain-containing protein n=1 Tax=Gandjariella thermophila TaxID=1931992 RepID=A0A4D4J5R7_9PSEU|nr:PPE domain-containing protein [Gandjariella thermophila]GDY30442.1 hypothetical protein GTS_20750 [Gandjariella thermophila]
MGEPSVGYHRFEGHSLADKHGWMRQGAGAAELEKVRSALAALGGDLAASARSLRDAVRQLGGEWQGATAEQAAAQMVAAAAWAGDSGGTASQAGSTVERQAEVVGDIRSRVPQPPGCCDGAGGAMRDGGRTLFDAATLGVFGVQHDAQLKVEAYRQADAAANSALYAYESSSRAHADAMPALPQPPPITVTAATHPSSAAAPPPQPPVSQQPHPEPPDHRHDHADHRADDRSHGTDLVAGGLGLGAGVLAGGATLSDGMRGSGRGIGGGSLRELLDESGPHAGTRSAGAAAGLGPLNEEEAEARATRAATTAPDGSGVAGGRGRGERDGEHTGRYTVPTDVYYVADVPRLAPPVIGEDPADG